LCAIASRSSGEGERERQVLAAATVHNHLFIQVQNDGDASVIDDDVANYRRPEIGDRLQSINGGADFLNHSPIIYSANHRHQVQISMNEYWHSSHSTTV